jgi:asparagine synthase (glutamine-hydrolysing)
MQEAIFGIFCRNNSVIPPSALDKMKAASNICESNDCGLWTNNGIGLGWSHGINQCDDICYTCLSGIIFIASGRVDNASELGSLLGIPKTELQFLSDYEIMRQAYLKWGENCSARIFGDWAFAAWHPIERRLFLSRDHHGNTSLYFYSDQRIFVFSTSRQAILSLDLVTIELDELYLAQHLISWQAYQGERTLYKPIKRLPPAH